VQEVRAELGDTPIGIHAHDDSGLGVANSLAAVEAGASHVQGTINGYGERCGNANLTSIIPNLVLKLKKKSLDEEQLKELKALSHSVDEIANLVPNMRAPFIGQSAFAHKGGIHVSAIRRNRACYEHIEPELVGNKTRILISELSGVSNLASKSEEMGLTDDTSNEAMRSALDRIKRLENEGYSFEAAEASMHLLLEEASGRHRPHFELIEARTTIDKRGHDHAPVTEATMKVLVGDDTSHTVADGDGPVDALAHALKKALSSQYPAIEEIRLLDYKVRVMDAAEGTAAKVRVLITSGNGKETWSTVGVSENIIQASWQALVDSYEYFLLRSDEVKNRHNVGEPNLAKV
jgi:2-isopropylmalate synthase